jgi:hypothetical protein
MGGVTSMNWEPISREVGDLLAAFADEATSASPGFAVSPYHLDPSGKIFEVGASFATQGRDPDEEADLRIFLERAPYETPPTPESKARHHFPPFEAGRDFLWFCIDARGQDIGTLNPILLPADRASKEYEEAVQTYVAEAKQALAENRERIIEYLAGLG